MVLDFACVFLSGVRVKALPHAAGRATRKDGVAKDLPARLDVAATAKLLGFGEQDIQILMAVGKPCKKNKNPRSASLHHFCRCSKRIIADESYGGGVDSQVRHAVSRILRISQAEEQISRGRRDGYAVRAVGGGDGITARCPTRRCSEIVVLLQRVAARVWPGNLDAVRPDK